MTKKNSNTKNSQDKKKRPEKVQKKIDRIAEAVNDSGYQLKSQCAIDILLAKLQMINAELSKEKGRTVVNQLSSRIKSPESIVKKLKKNGYESSIQNMVNYVNDIAGIRIVCSFTSDIYRMAEMIGKQNDLTVVSIKDYIKNPKQSGYKSYHMLVTVPIFMSDRVIDTKVEIQIRTIAMDFWASLEHKIYYKFEGNAPEYISRELRECSGIVSVLDDKMLSLNEAILKAKAEAAHEAKS